MTDASVLSDSTNRQVENILQVNVADAIRQLRAIDNRPGARFDCRTLPVVHSKTFINEELDGKEFAAWVRHHNRELKLNTFFTLNEARKDWPRDKPVTAKGIGLIRAFPVDMDARGVEHPKGARTKNECLATLIADENPPTIIIDSGTGGWGYLVPENPTTVESIDAVAQTKALIAHFDSDISCHDLPRVTRMAGTINWKNPELPALAKVMSANGPKYSLAELAAAFPPLAQSGVDCIQSGKGAPPVDEISTETDRLKQGVYYLIHEAPESIEGDYGDDHLYETACGLKNRGIPAPDCVDLLTDVYNPIKARPEWSRDEIRAKVRSAFNNKAVLFGRDTAVNPEMEFEPIALAGLPLMCVTADAMRGISARDWLLGKFLARRAVTSFISPGGTGKSTHGLMVAVAVTSGRGDILGLDVRERTAALVWNQEDELEELRRRLAAVLQFYGLKEEDTYVDGKPGIILGSGVERRLTLARRNSAGAIVPTADTSLIVDALAKHKAGLLILDPLVELHQANENDNGEMNVVVGGVIRDKIAVPANCAVILDHHTRKPSQASGASYAGDPDSGRGAGSLNAAVRVAATLYSVDSKTAKEYGIAEEKRHLYVRLDDAKGNMSLKSGEPIFFRKESVTISCRDDKSEEVGVLSLAKLARAAKDGSKADTLVADVLALVEGDTEAWVTDLAEELMSDPLYAMDSPALLARRIASAFRNAKSTNGWCAKKASRPGEKGPRVQIVFLPETDGKQNGKQTEAIELDE